MADNNEPCGCDESKRLRLAIREYMENNDDTGIRSAYGAPPRHNTAARLKTASSSGDWFDKVRAQGAAFIGDDGKSMPIPMMGAYSERCAGGGAAFLRWLEVEGPATDMYPLDVTVQGPMATKAEGHLIGAREVDGELVLTVRMEREACDREAVKARRSRVIHEIILNDKGGDYCQTGGADPYWIAWPLSGRVRLYTEAVSEPKTCYTAHQLATEVFPNMKLLMKKEMECPTRAAYVWAHKRFIEGVLTVELHPLSELDSPRASPDASRVERLKQQLFGNEKERP